MTRPAQAFARLLVLLVGCFFVVRGNVVLLLFVLLFVGDFQRVFSEFSVEGVDFRE